MNEATKKLGKEYAVSLKANENYFWFFGINWRRTAYSFSIGKTFYEVKKLKYPQRRQCPDQKPMRCQRETFQKTRRIVF